MRERAGVRGVLAAVLMAAWMAVAAAAPVAVPAPLQPWQDWVRHGHEHRDCPLLQGQAAGPVEAHVCAWPGALELAVDASGARFALDWWLLQAGEVGLPGDARHRPLAVTVGGRPQPVRLRDGRPVLRLEAGRHRVEGRFEWQRRPEQLALPGAIGIVALQVDGQPVAVPERRDDQLWLGRGADLPVGADSLSLRLYRQLADGVPLTLKNELQLEVSGRAREVVLGRALPDGFVPIAIDSPLPAVIGPDGLLRVQLRPGSWRLRIDARALQVVDAVQAPANPPPWPAEEIWSYRAAPALRSTEPVGARQVDPQQVGAPWDDALPSFVLGAGDTLGIEQRSRGLDPERAHRLSLRRDLWLDFDGGGATARDRIEGRLAPAGRLELAPPWQLLQARADGEDLLITRAAEAPSSGIELRQLELELDALARREHLQGRPASGWQQDFEAMSMVLHLPPGWLLLHAGGADSADAAWLAQWDLLDLFLLAFAALLAQRLLGIGSGVLVFAYLLLAYHQPGAPLWTLLALLAVGLLLGLLPAGRLARAVGLLQALLLLLLVGWTLPFAAGQLKLALYPSLEREQVVKPHQALPSREVVEVTFLEPPRGRMAQEMAPPPPPPPSPSPMAMADATLDRIEVTGSRITEEDLRAADAVLARYPADAIVQAGPGVPDWGWRAARIEWQGPVLQSQTLRLWLSPPWLTSLLRLALVGLLLALLWRLGRRLRRPAATRSAPPAVPSAAAALVLSVSLLAATAPSEAAGFPPPALLDDLRERLFEPADCVPECAALAHAELRLDGERLQLALDLLAEADTAVPLPEAGRGAALLRVQLDATAVPLVRRDGMHWLRLPRGVHRVSLDWQLGAVDALELRFPLPPARLRVQAESWEAAGLQEARLIGDTLQLLRRARASADGADSPAPVQDFPPFVRITRTLVLDLDWQLQTRVQRVAPAQAGFSLALPLLPGERVLDDEHEVDGERITVAFAAGQDSISWRSQLPIGARLELTAPPLDRSAEHWQLRIGPLWRVRIDGVPEVDEPDAGGQRSFRPLPGETLSLAIERPAALPGASVAIDAADLALQPGQRAVDATLRLALRSTRGGPHALTLPAQAELLGVELDDAPLTLRLADDGLLVLPLAPGEQSLELRWRQAAPLATVMRTPAVGLGAPAANLRIAVELPADRWLLATSGGGIGPALLYWPQLLLLALLAFALGRLGGTPLRFHHWLLLGLGFSTVSWLAGAIVAGWLLLLGWRGRQAVTLAAGHRWWFGIVQLGLLLATVLALLALVVALKQGLLGNPDMQLTGNGSAVNWYGVAGLYWFFDRAADALPEVQLLSLPLWVYKLAILAWALWLANALIGWLRWGWAGFAAGGYWPPRRPQTSVAE